MFVDFLDFLIYRTPVFYLTQSVWRDEVFSYFMSRPDILRIIVNTANDFNPPLYYLLLHFWGKFSGNSDIWLRLLSFVFHLTGVYFAYLLSRHLTNKKQSYYLSLFYLFNPMLIYYAFEMRMYSLYALTATAAIYFFYTKNWKGYIISSVLGLYSHSFFILIILSLSVYNFINRKLRKDLIKTLSPILFFLPWIPILAVQFVKSKESWLFPVDWQLIKSVLGNLFTAYEGTPGHLWKYTFYLSLAIVSFLILCFRNNKLKGKMFILPIVIPLAFILTYSVIKRPIYVNRYLIFVSVFEVLAVFTGIISIKNQTVRKAVAFLWMIFIILFNLYITPFRKKTDFKTTFKEINKMAREEDAVYAMTPIGFLESAYYFKYPNKTFVYNPNKVHIPNYIGVNVVYPDISRTDFPPPPSRVFLVNDDATFEVVFQQ
ncbi:hypothetical protein A2W14_06390 [Candidatus Gottesmanbacteria bacterium RBG_16_37_8]|uniref:Glycosyltransferase RgtA/B/C/D-like domain-containing protein n=1 Tax=Candidatus Gottesmanbacteria bacterium RBG_16_37_8 TaxID=1798371 RepID=A0A1F5YPX5_9BACT|nr:MAG: hypothetical protein A2W14_06390 [Candidatus Gottesmanbacteria bacterium RBG_16_37_8]